MDTSFCSHAYQTFQLDPVCVNRVLARTCIPAFVGSHRDQGRRRRRFYWDQKWLEDGTARLSSRWNGCCSQPSQTRSRSGYRSWDWRICNEDVLNSELIKQWKLPPILKNWIHPASIAMGEWSTGAHTAVQLFTAYLSYYYTCVLSMLAGQVVVNLDPASLADTL